MVRQIARSDGESKEPDLALLPLGCETEFFLDLQIADLRDDLGLRSFVSFVSFCSLPAPRRLGTGTGQFVSGFLETLGDASPAKSIL
jgi:hypothetical protein